MLLEESVLLCEVMVFTAITETDENRSSGGGARKV